MKLKPISSETLSKIAFGGVLVLVFALTFGPAYAKGGKNTFKNIIATFSKNFKKPSSRAQSKNSDNDPVLMKGYGYGYGDNRKIMICQATGSKKKPYQQITLSWSTVNNYVKGKNDIIPAPPSGCPIPKWTILKGHGSQVYGFDGSELRPFTSMKAFHSWGHGSSIVQFDDSEFGNWPIGKPIR